MRLHGFLKTRYNQCFVKTRLQTKILVIYWKNHRMPHLILFCIILDVEVHGIMNLKTGFIKLTKWSIISSTAVVAVKSFNQILRRVTFAKNADIVFALDVQVNFIQMFKMN